MRWTVLRPQQMTCVSCVRWNRQLRHSRKNCVGRDSPPNHIISQLGPTSEYPKRAEHFVLVILTEWPINILGPEHSYSFWYLYSTFDEMRAACFLQGWRQQHGRKELIKSPLDWTHASMNLNLKNDVQTSTDLSHHFVIKIDISLFFS